MSRRRREGLSPSLFPFLAVLVCTLGTLILFLALVAQDATDTAEQNSRSRRMTEAKLQAAEPVTGRLTAKSVESMIATERFHVEQLVAIRDQQTANVEDRRDQLTHLEDHLNRIRQKLTRLSDEVDLAMSETEVEQIDQSAIEELRTRIAGQRAAVEKLRSESEDKTPRFVIVPHKGPNGTDRRPVYLECTDQGVTIWPEGSQITTTNLEDADRSANPLDAALRVVRHYAMQTYGDAAPPYPLLVVRPNGIEAYAAARNAMQDWDDQFGYELVPADIKLAFSKPDSNLKQRVDLAIRNAAVKQHARHALAQRSLGGGRRSYGGGQHTVGSGRRGRMPTLSAASLDRAGRANGFRALKDDYAIGSQQPGRSPYTSSSSSYAGNSPYTTGNQDDRFNGNTFNGGNGAAANGQWDDAMRSAAGEIRDARVRSGGNGGLGSGDSVTDRSGTQAIQPPQTNPHVAETREGSEAGDADFAAADRASRATSGTSSSDNPDAPSAGGPDASFSGDSRTSTGNSQQPSQQSQSQPSALAPTQGSGAASQPSSSSAMMSGQAQSNRSASEGESTPNAAPPVNIDTNASKNPVRRQGRDWALPAKMVGASGNEIVRTIRVQCYPDRFVLLAPGRGGATEVFGLAGGDIDRATLQLATAVRDRIARWGAALPGGRWAPRLDVEVMPRGEARFHQMRTLMSGSGVEVTGRTSR